MNKSTLPKLQSMSVESNEGLTMVTLDDVALTRQMTYELGILMNALEEDPQTRVIIFTGRRNLFLSGIKLDEVNDLNGFESAREILEIPEVIWKWLYNIKKPTIAAINGFCLGAGLELALACDIRIAVDEVKNIQGRSVPYIGMLHAARGMTPHLGGTQLLPRIVGLSNAKRMIFSAEPITAQEALNIGLVTHVVPRDRLVEEAEDLASKLLMNSSLALSYAKSLINDSFHMSSLSEGLALERDAFARCCESPEKRERINAALDRKRPNRKTEGHCNGLSVQSIPETPGAEGPPVRP